MIPTQPKVNIIVVTNGIIKTLLTIINIDVVVGDHSKRNRRPLK